MNDSTKPAITEAEAEAMADRMVQRRLERSCLYRYAPDAEEQAKAEAKVEAEVWSDLEARYEIGGAPQAEPIAEIPSVADVLAAHAERTEARDRYVVIENTPGYLPEDDEPATFAEYGDAVAYMRDLVAEYVSQIEDAGAEAEVSEGWASADNYAAVMVYRSDRTDDLGRYFGVERSDA